MSLFVYYQNNYCVERSGVCLSFLLPTFFRGYVCFRSCLTSAVIDRILPVSFYLGFTDCIVFCSAILTSQLATAHALDALLQTLSFPKSSQEQVMTLSLLTNQPSKMNYAPIALSCQIGNKVIWCPSSGFSLWLARCGRTSTPPLLSATDSWCIKR